LDNPDRIIITGARLHNLKNISLEIPKNKFVVFTGLSGSGKSTLGFDILYKEGQRQYFESMGLIPFGMAKPTVDSITGLSPSISLDQHLANHSPRSTVGTSTGLYTFLRILYARLGIRPCPYCSGEVPAVSQMLDQDWEGGTSADEDPALEDLSFPCPHCGKPILELTMAHFSFNKPAGACPACTGLGSLRQVDFSRVVDGKKSISEGAVAGWEEFHIKYYLASLEAAARHYHIEFVPAQPVEDYPIQMRDLLFYGVESPVFQKHFPSMKIPTSVRRGRFEGIGTNLLRRHAEHLSEHIQEEGYQDKLDEYLVTQTCPECAGTRLRPESREVRLEGKNIVELTRFPLDDLGIWVGQFQAGLTGEKAALAGTILTNMKEGIKRLVDAGAGYLSLERASPSLSAGESQRLRLASLLGSGLGGVLYVFDEPTIGLHHRDTGRMVSILRRLRDLGNTIIVIEHDLEMIAAADILVDFGPGAGKEGGRIVAQGTPGEVMEAPGSLTGDYLSRRKAIPVPQSRRDPNGRKITILGARHNNLKNISVPIPLGLLVAVTGVSGSGKSSLIFDILDRSLRQRLYGSADKPGDHDEIQGIEEINKVITIDQEYIGRIPRSNAATYSDIFTPIRDTFAKTQEARSRGFTSRQFSFNVPGGRCARCEGTGILTVQMQFLPDVEVRCPACHGSRFTRETLAVHYHGFDISQVLDMTVDEALDLFAEIPAAHSRLKVLSDVGLGYLQLGQPATTLSGGEAQRVKLAKELGRHSSGMTLYLLDEPTTGLHLADTARLLNLLQKLVEQGNSVIVVEHNLEFVKAADWVIDLGPGGGGGGGRVVAAGTPEQVAREKGSNTGEGLKQILK
jgi:excinuclease ABC subunit A